MVVKTHRPGWNRPGKSKAPPQQGGTASAKEVDQSVLSLSFPGLYFVHVRHRTLLLDVMLQGRRAYGHKLAGGSTRRCLRTETIAICPGRMIWSMSRCGGEAVTESEDQERVPESEERCEVLFAQKRRMRRWAACVGGSTATPAARTQIPYRRCAATKAVWRPGRTAARPSGWCERVPTRSGLWSASRVRSGGQGVQCCWW